MSNPNEHVFEPAVLGSHAGELHGIREIFGSETMLTINPHCKIEGIYNSYKYMHQQNKEGIHE